MLKILMFLAIVAAVWFWRDSMRNREIVLGRCRSYCDQYQYQLLDATVAINRLWLQRCSSGRLAIGRKYQFEYSVAGTERRKGYALIACGLIREIYLEQQDGTHILEANQNDRDDP